MRAIHRPGWARNPRPPKKVLRITWFSDMWEGRWAGCAGNIISRAT